MAEDLSQQDAARAEPPDGQLSKELAHVIVDVGYGLFVETNRPDGSKNGMPLEAQKEYLAALGRHLDVARSRGEPVVWVSIRSQDELNGKASRFHNSKNASGVRDFHELGFLPPLQAVHSEEQRQVFDATREWLNKYGPRLSEAVLEKTTFGSFADSHDLVDYLNGRGVGQVNLMGGNDKVCLSATAVGCAAHGFFTRVLTNLLVGDENRNRQESHQQTKERLSGFLDKYLYAQNDLRPHEAIIVGQPVVYGETAKETIQRVGASIIRGRIGFAFSTAAVENAFEIRTGQHFPQSVSDVFIHEASSRFAAGSQNQSIMWKAPSGYGEPTFTPDQAKELVLNAFYAFDNKLGARAERIVDSGFSQSFASADDRVFWNDRQRWRKDKNTRIADAQNLAALPDGQRWRIAEVPKEQAFMMRSIPAESAGSADYFNPPNKHPFNPPNKHPYAVIDFHFDGTMNSVVYLAHELGHAIADDTIRQAGFANHTSPVHMDETQAYFTQRILYDHLAQHPDANIRLAAQQNFADMVSNDVQRHVMNNDVERIHGRPLAILTSSALVDVAQGMNGEGRSQLIDTLMGAQGPKNIEEVFSSAAVNGQQIQQLAQKTASSIAASGAASVTPVNPAEHLNTKITGLNGRVGLASIGIGLADAAIKGDATKAAEIVGTASVLHVGMKGVAAFAGIRAVPVAGQMVGAGFAAKDAFESVASGNTRRAIVSGVETSLYATATVAGAAAAFNFWNPAGWGAGAVALASGSAAVTISAGKAIHDNWNTIGGWFQSYQKAQPVHPIVDESISAKNTESAPLPMQAIRPPLRSVLRGDVPDNTQNTPAAFEIKASVSPILAPKMG